MQNLLEIDSEANMEAVVKKKFRKKIKKVRKNCAEGVWFVWFV